VIAGNNIQQRSPAEEAGLFCVCTRFFLRQALHASTATWQRQLIQTTLLKERLVPEFALTACSERLYRWLLQTRENNA
jgi:hypothetical protein